MAIQELITIFILVLILISLLIVLRFYVFTTDIYKRLFLIRKLDNFNSMKLKSKSKILFIGDSSIVGFGASEISKTIPGRFHEKYPKIYIENKAKNGARTCEVLKQLKNSNLKKYDLIVSLNGINDVIKRSNFNQVTKCHYELIELAKKKGKIVLFGMGGNLGLSPILFWPLNLLLMIREKKLRKIFLNLVKGKDIIYVDLFTERKDDKYLTKEPRKYFALDFMHPSDEGYKLIFNFLIKALKKDKEGKRLLKELS